MSNILATFRITRDKLINYYNNGIDTEKVEREKEDDWKIIKIYKFFSQPNLIIEKNNIKLYLGNSYNAANFKTLDNLNIDCVLNISNEIPNYFLDNFKYLQISVPDINSCSISYCFDSVIKFFFENIDAGNKNFFVHCYYGASRSATIVLLLLVRYYNLDFEDAKSLLDRKRDVINMNIVFLRELKNYLDIEKN
jgi:protein-tyrosine phosphatase